MTDDVGLLRRYAQERDEDAFGEVVRRHIDLVYSAALRQVGGDAASAADVTQEVITELARQARSLARHPTLTGWLYVTTRRVAAHAIRDEVRRQRREQKAYAMQEPLHHPAPADPEPDWEQLRPVLDDAMNELSEGDRLAVLLRHFERRPLTEVGDLLGLSENAARMRVDRALARLRVTLAKRGVTSSAAALAVALSGHAVAAAPAALAGTVTTAALSAATATLSTLLIPTLMTTTSLKVTAIAVALAAAGTVFVVQNRLRDRLAADNAELRRKVTALTDEARTSRETQVGNDGQLERERLDRAELLKLRGEVGRLRQERSAARSAGAAAPQATASQPPADVDEAEEEAKQFDLRRRNESKVLVLGMFLFAKNNQNQFSDTLEAGIAQLKADGVELETLKSLRIEEYEMVFKGSILDIATPGSEIILRARTPWRTHDGRWARTYGFADGHSEIHFTDDGDFRAWEAQHQAKASAANPP